MDVTHFYPKFLFAFRRKATLPTLAGVRWTTNFVP